MPNRMLKESICTSDNIDKLSLLAETAFYRLIVNCDDFGRMDARTPIVRSRLFPLKKYEDEDIDNVLDELVNADLIEIYRVNGRPYLQMKTWTNHQQVRATKSKCPGPEERDHETSNDSDCNQIATDCNQLISTDINCNQEITDDNNCPRKRNRNRNTINDNRLSFIAREDAIDINDDHNRLLDEAEKAGFNRTDAVRERLIALYADYGMEKMLEALNSCVRYNVITIAYLEGVLKGGPKKPKASKRVVAQEYSQRDYQGEQDEAMKRMIAMGGSG